MEFPQPYPSVVPCYNIVLRAPKCGITRAVGCQACGWYSGINRACQPRCHGAEGGFWAASGLRARRPTALMAGNETQNILSTFLNEPAAIEYLLPLSDLGRETF